MRTVKLRIIPQTNCFCRNLKTKVGDPRLWQLEKTWKRFHCWYDAVFTVKFDPLKNAYFFDVETPHFHWVCKFTFCETHFIRKRWENKPCQLNKSLKILKLPWEQKSTIFHFLMKAPFLLIWQWNLLKIWWELSNYGF